MAENLLYYGDNLDVLRRHVKDESVDLIYLDPPFNSNADYNVLFGHADGTRAAAQIKAFGDTWRWDQAAATDFQTVVSGGGKVAEVMVAFQTMLGDSNMLAYLAMMAPRLVELRRVLRPTGSLYLHCDPTASHYLKLLLDAALGARNFRNEIIWCYRGGGVPRKDFAKKHDTIFRYSKSDTYFFDVDAVRIPYSDDVLASLPSRYDKSYRENKVYEGYRPNPLDKHPEDWWEIQPIMPSSGERLGYPTQKPLLLLERIIKASSQPGDVVLDPFCGCGTTVAAAEKLDRAWVGIDITYLAISLIKSRLTGEGVSDYKVLGEPTTADDAAQLAKDDPYQFQWWSLGLIGARPAEGRKGADQGVDGRLFFFDEGTDKPKQLIASVKAGRLQPQYVRELRGVIERENAQLGVLISFNEPTQAMRQEAASVGFYQSPWGQHPRLQLLTVGDLLAGKRVDMPAGGAHMTQVALPPTPEETVHPDQLSLGEL